MPSTGANRSRSDGVTMHCHASVDFSACRRMTRSLCVLLN